VHIIYGFTRREPFRSDWGLRDQIQRAAVSVMSNIAESFERGSNKEFIQFLYQAKSSAGEVRSQLYVALDLSYITQPEFNDTNRLCHSISRGIGALIEYLRNSDLKGPKFRETGPVWTIEP